MACHKSGVTSVADVKLQCISSTSKPFLISDLTSSLCSEHPLCLHVCTYCQFCSPTSSCTNSRDYVADEVKYLDCAFLWHAFCIPKSSNLSKFIMLFPRSLRFFTKRLLACVILDMYSHFGLYTR